MSKKVTKWVVGVRVGGIEWDEGSGGRHGGLQSCAASGAPRDEGARALVREARGVSI